MVDHAFCNPVRPRRVRTATVAVAMIAMLASATGAWAQKLYKSVGPDGKIIYGDRPPAEGRVEKSMSFDNLPASSLPANTASYVEQLRRLREGGAAAVPTGDVLLFSAKWCGYCTKAKAYLTSKSIAYREVDIDSPAGMASFAQAGGAGGGIPFLVASGKHLRGFTAGAYDAFFAQGK